MNDFLNIDTCIINLLYPFFWFGMNKIKYDLQFFQTTNSWHQYVQ